MGYIIVLFVILIIINFCFILKQFIIGNVAILYYTNIFVSSLAIIVILILESRQKIQSLKMQKEIEKLKLALETINKETEILYSLNKVSEAFSENSQLYIVFGQILNSIKKILKVDIAAISIVEEYDKNRAIKVVQGKSSIEFDDIVYKRTIFEGHSFTVNNLSPQHTDYKNYKILYSQGFKSLIVASLQIKKEVIGFISALTLEPHDFTSEDLRFMKMFALQAALIIQNARLLDINMKLAITDEMTQLYNYRHFVQRIEEEFFRSVRYKRPFSLLILDIDYFKSFNDTYGHLTGDLVLKKIAHILKTNIRPTDIAFRYGGEEFAILLIETDKKEAASIAERIREIVSKTVFYTDQNKPTKEVTVTIGVATFSEDIKLTSQLIRNADMALYKGKNSGRNKVVVY